MVPFSETMKIAEVVENNVVILEINGRMTLETQDSELSGLVKKRLAGGHRSFLVNLHSVPYCDTQGLAELVATLTMTQDAKAALRLVNVRPYVYTLLNTAGLIGLFQVFDSIETGLKSFES